MICKYAVRAAIFSAFLIAAQISHAEVRLPKLFSNHMVLQRDKPIHIWGWSEVGEKVTIGLNGMTATTTGDDLGHWSVYLPPQPAGGPFQLEITGNNKLAIGDVLLGDVWLASGQSNMEMPLSGFPGSAVVQNAADEIKNANHPNMRLFTVSHATPDYPLNDFAGNESWQVCSPETAAKFSAVAYFFGRDLMNREHVPIGLIDSTWGGTPGSAWVSLDRLSSDASLIAVFSARAHMVEHQAELPAIIASEKRAVEAARAANRPVPQFPWHPPQPSSWRPAALFNGMISPAVGFSMAGAIWYQGESDSGPERASLYGKVFPELISDWRAQWQQGSFPFLFVQIANFNASPSENWPVVREAQMQTLSLMNTAMAVTIDIGDPTNIHPANKQAVGDRLALAARALAYGENVEYSGPLFRQATPENGSIRVWFTHANGGLTAKGDELQSFEVAGADHRFVPATARINGPTVLVSNGQIPSPQYVRYAWSNAPIASLFNTAGLPASPFTSEPREGGRQ